MSISTLNQVIEPLIRRLEESERSREESERRREESERRSREEFQTNLLEAVASLRKHSPPRNVGSVYSDLTTSSKRRY